MRLLGFIMSPWPWLLALILLAGVMDGQEMDQFVDLRTHSIRTPYIEDGLQLRWFDFGGDTMVSSLSPQGAHIALTNDRPSQSGWLYSRQPLTLGSVRIEVEFKIHGKGSGLFGDGMAIWLTQGRGKMGHVFGLEDKWTGLGLFIDTFANARHSFGFPRILAFPNDGTVSYDAGSDGAKQHPEGAACSAYLRDPGHPTKLRLVYRKDKKQLTVELQYRGVDEWENCFELSDLVLPNEVYLGFSALTGELSDSHEILKVTTSNLVPKQPVRTPGKGLNQKGRQGGRRASPRKSTGRSWFTSLLLALIKIIAVVAFCAVAYMAWTQYQAQTRNKRF